MNMHTDIMICLRCCIDTGTFIKVSKLFVLCREGGELTDTVNLAFIRGFLFYFAYGHNCFEHLNPAMSCGNLLYMTTVCLPASSLKS